MSRELDAQCARLLGWVDIEDMEPGWWGVSPESVAAKIHITASPFEPIPQYSTDPALTPILLAEIARIDRHLLEQEDNLAISQSAISLYVHHLMDEMDAAPFDDDLWLWQAINATPEQHACAFVKAMESLK